MRTTARVIQSTQVALPDPFFFKLTRRGLAIASLFLMVFFSALGVIYVKDLNRRLFIQYQNLQQVRQQTETEWGRLLLEQSAWSTQARVQQIAMTRLQMVVPSSRNIVMVQEQDA